LAKFVTTDYQFTLDSNDLSTSAAAITLEITVEEQETTAFGNSSRTRIGGLRDASLSIDFHQDFGAGGIDSILEPLLGSVVPFSIQPTSEAISATNPSYSGSVLITSYSPFANSVGDLASFSVTLPVSGDITRGTA